MKSDFFSILSVSLLLTANAVAQTYATMQIDFQGPVQYVVMDSQGNRCGYDPISREGYHEISYAGYGFAGEDSMTAWEFAFNHSLRDTSFSTVYTVELFGIELGVFVGDGGASQTWSGKGLNFHVVGVIDSNQTVTYRLGYSTDSTITPTFIKVVTPGIIRQDFKDCFKLKLLGDEGFYRESRNRLDNFERHLDHKDSVEARKELQRFWNRVHEVYSDTTGRGNEDHHGKSGEIGRGRKDFVMQEAYRILDEDVNLMLAQLPAKHGRGDEDEGRGKR